ncbi:hypothetical protein JYT48_00550 [Mariprofundus ferrooxydans]|nr:hypothetical protein [Mariprofundus ferrooxydans]MBN4076745.1 hypothetical protein [Mariprofundus ferrooxydans]
MPDKEIMNQDECAEKSVDAGIWMRMVRNYAVLMVVGLLMLAYLMPQLHDNVSKPMMAGVMIGGLALFGGGFGAVVSLLFHYINRKS